MAVRLFLWKQQQQRTADKNPHMYRVVSTFKEDKREQKTGRRQGLLSPPLLYSRYSKLAPCWVRVRDRWEQQLGFCFSSSRKEDAEK